MSTTVTKGLALATELVQQFSITDKEVVSISVSRFYVSLQLEHAALARVFNSLRLPKASLKTNINDGLHLSFTYRGCRWTSYVKLENEKDWRACIAEDATPALAAPVPRIAGRPSDE